MADSRGCFGIVNRMQISAGAGCLKYQNKQLEILVRSGSVREREKLSIWSTTSTAADCNVRLSPAVSVVVENLEITKAWMRFPNVHGGEV